jgi:hypothetical protein
MVLNDFKIKYQVIKMINVKKYNSRVDVSERTILDGIKFILSHFEKQHELFPRTIMTSATRGQVKVEYDSQVQNSINKIFNVFRESNYYDCKINGFPYNSQHTNINLDVKNKTAASFIMIDLDLQDFSQDKKKLDNILNKTLNKLSNKFYGESHPSVIWTGNGYHIYQPLEGIIFEKQKIFYDFLAYTNGRDLTSEFLRFAEKFFTDGKADPKHFPSIKSCLIRVPGTFNFKNGEQVKIIQKWDGKSPAIQWITYDFKGYLIQNKIDKIYERKMEIEKNLSIYKPLGRQDNKIEWIENLLQTPIEDFRKQCLWQILCPYLVNIRKLANEEVETILNEWLQKCSNLRKIDFNPQIKIKDDLKNVKKYLPPSKERLKKEYKELYNIFRSKNIISY